MATYADAPAIRGGASPEARSARRVSDAIARARVSAEDNAASDDRRCFAPDSMLSMLFSTESKTRSSAPRADAEASVANEVNRLEMVPRYPPVSSPAGGAEPPSAAVAASRDIAVRRGPRS